MQNWLHIKPMTVVLQAGSTIASRSSAGGQTYLKKKKKKNLVSNLSKLLSLHYYLDPWNFLNIGGPS